MYFRKPLLMALLFLLCTGRLLATHYYGVDLFYTHVSGNTYRVSLVAFGDCSGAQFPSFSTTRPRIYVRQGSTDILTDFLDPEPPRDGIEVTPVCPEELNNTTCVNPAGTVPGIKKFVYSKEFTLSGPAPDWKFVFQGETDASVTAGRSNSLTNVSPPGFITVEATLDNTLDNNSSPEYTTIATPFYCVNRQINFNPGAVDADGDSLVYELVPGLSGATELSYVQGFSGSHPLAVAPGLFNFNSNTGQLSFTANQLQKSLVVYRVSEYRKGKLTGTSMREMTVIVLPCDNNPPVGYITNASGAAIVDTVTVKTCIGNHEVAFDINPVDADNGDIIKMEVKGLPQNSRLDITDNNTTHPRSRFVWNMPDLSEGDYSFYVTYTDDGCPIASKQTQAYTIRIAHEDIFAEAVAAACRIQGMLKITVPPGWLPWDYKIYKGPTLVNGKTNITVTTSNDNLAAGRYSVRAVNYLGCTDDTTLEVPSTCEVADLPNAFSPNRDGHNDILLVRGENVHDMHLRIYNRWGQLVFETTNMNTGWDGKYKGTDAPVEAYAFVLSVVFNSGQVFQKQGNITLLR